jgi:hypothetical protein
MGAWPISWPSTPPGARGSSTFSDHMRRYSRPTLPANIRAKPIQRITVSPWCSGSRLGGLDHEAVVQAPVALPDGAREADAQPPGGKAEDEQQQVGQPGAGAAAQVGDVGTAFSCDQPGSALL